MKIGVIGCGNVGFSHLRWLYNKNFSVKGFDINNIVKEKIHKEFGESCVANSFSDLKDCNALHICVPTDSAVDGSIDLSIFSDVIYKIKEIFYAKNNICVVQKSTCSPGSADKFSLILGPKFSYGVNPSFIRKGNIKEDVENPERVAIGGEGLVIEHLKNIYSSINAPKYISNNKTAIELLKYIENTIDSLLISYWNEIIEYATLIGIKAPDFIRIMEEIVKRPKFRSVIRVPGKAFGMWCLPKDLKALIFSMEKLGVSCDTLKGVLSTNLRFEETVGCGEISSINLWNEKSNKSEILSEGIKQIEIFMKAYGRNI